MTVRTGKNIDISENAVISELILIFEITPAAPLADIYSDRVCARKNKLRNVKFRHKAASLRKSRILPVYVYFSFGRNALKNKISIKTSVGKIKITLVNPDGIYVGNIRRITGKRIVDV